MAPFENCRSSNFRETRRSSHLRVVDKVVDKGLDLGVEDEGLQLPAVSSVDKVRSWEVTMGDKVSTEFEIYAALAPLACFGALFLHLTLTAGGAGGARDTWRHP